MFSQLVGQHERVRTALDALAIRYQYLDGSTPAKERERGVAAFQDGEGAVFLINLRAGGLGLNLTRPTMVAPCSLVETNRGGSGFGSGTPDRPAPTGHRLPADRRG